MKWLYMWWQYRPLGKQAPKLTDYLFCWAYARHWRKHARRGGYEVCRGFICRVCWWLENRLWYGGEAGR